MKKLSILFVLILVNINLFANESFYVKGIKFNISFEKIPYPKSVSKLTLKSLSKSDSKYEISYLDDDDINDNKENVIQKLTQELKKYPHNVLQKYIPKTFIIVHDIYNKKSHQFIDGLWSYGDNIIYSVTVFEGMNEYWLRVIHHEIFHSIEKANGPEFYETTIKLNNVLGRDYNNKSYLEEDNCLHFQEPFITAYHPNATEVGAEIFSLLMHNNFRHNSAIIDWYVSDKSKLNPKLKESIKIIIDFTSLISNGEMDTEYYFNIINR